MALADRWRYQKWHRRHGPPLRGQAEGDDLAHLFRALLKSLHDGGYAVSMGAFSIRSYPQFYKIPYVLCKSSIKNIEILGLQVRFGSVGLQDQFGHFLGL